MTLGELIDCAVEAHTRYGDLNVVMLDSNGKDLFDALALDLMVADVTTHDGTKTVFAFMPVASLRKDVQ